jgi:AcrR family transcriptional regulator
VQRYCFFPDFPNFFPSFFFFLRKYEKKRTFSSIFLLISNKKYNFAHDKSSVQLFGEIHDMSIFKTRQLLVDVARQLFAKQGLENTTMNDIAQASGKGRRTLYTYFKSKEEIYYAVIEAELERLSEKLDEVAARKIPPQEKIIELIYTHLSQIRETVVRNGNLRAEFFRNIWMVEKVRKHFDDAEIELFRKVYTEGKEDGEFDIDNIDLVADITHYCIKGLEVPYIYGRIAHGMTEEATKPQVAKVVYGALGKFQRR